MRIIIGCEHSGVVRSAFRDAGHEAWSVDTLPSEDNSRYHHQGDLIDFLRDKGDYFDMMIAFPPCTYLAASGLHWNNRIPGREQKTAEAVSFVEKMITYAPVKWAFENPVGRLSTALRKPDQYIQPYQFGHDASKKTGIWLCNLPKLKPTKLVKPGKNGRYGNQTPSGQNKLGPSPDRWKHRSRTYEGIAQAMVEQWGGA